MLQTPYVALINGITMGGVSETLICQITAARATGHTAVLGIRSARSKSDCSTVKSDHSTKKSECNTKKWPDKKIFELVNRSLHKCKFLTTTHMIDQNDELFTGSIEYLY